MVTGEILFRSIEAVMGRAENGQETERMAENAPTRKNPQTRTVDMMIKAPGPVS